MSGANVYVVFEAFETNRRRQVYLTRSTDRGQSWSTPVQLSTPTGTSFVAANGDLAEQYFFARFTPTGFERSKPKDTHKNAYLFIHFPDCTSMSHG